MSFPRYEKYKDSGLPWLAEIPNHWEIMQSRRLFALRKDRAKEDDRQLTASQKHGVIFQDDYTALEGQKVVQVITGSEILKHVEPNDFVISMRSFQGGIEWCRYRGSISSAYVMLIPAEEINVNFFRYLFKCKPYIQALQSTSNLVRDGQALRYENFTQIHLPVLPFSEQQYIANFLDRETTKIDELIAEQQRLIELLKEKRQAVISHAVTKGLNPDVPMKDSGVEWLGEIPQNWCDLPLKAVVSYNDEVLDEGTSDDTEILYVDISSVDAITGISSKESMLFSSAPSRARRRVKHGDVIVSTVRTYLRAIARILEPEENLIVSTGFCVVRPSGRVIHGFLGYILSSNYFIEAVISHSVGVSYPAINASDLVKIKIPLPSIPEQKSITAFLDREIAKLDTLTGEAQRVIKLLKERRTALISAAVTGKIDVREQNQLEEL